jgi:hypothetical protein
MQSCLTSGLPFRIQAQPGANAGVSLSHTKRVTAFPWPGVLRCAIRRSKGERLVFTALSLSRLGLQALHQNDEMRFWDGLIPDKRILLRPRHPSAAESALADVPDPPKT